jgi:ABC-type sulfate/molybdate transport systems ATPase subunit
LLVLFGHSGSGKSLTLRAIAGLTTPEAGRITIDDRPVFDAEAGINVPSRQRGVGLVVQSYALFPTMSVAENVGFGLHGWTRAARQARVLELLEVLGIADLARRRPAEISGGQAQRVALAPEPRLLLLDEPFSALDSAIRVNLRRELARLKRELDLTVVFVTHDLREAYNLADAIAVFDRGQVLQTGPRDEVFDRPVSARVAHLTEVRNVWHGRVTAVQDGVATLDLGGVCLRARTDGVAAGAAVACGIRPERVVPLAPDEPETALDARDGARLTATISDETPHGAWVTLFLHAGGLEIEADVPVARCRALDLRPGGHVEVLLASDAVRVMGE